MFVKNDKGEMVPYSAFMKIKKQQGLNEINRYNLYPTAAIQGAPAAGSALARPSRRFRKSPPRRCRAVTYRLAGPGLRRSQQGQRAIYIFLIVVVFVYLVLVGQYESFILPLAVIFSLPVGIFGSFLFLKAMGLANDVYAQIGLVMLVGLLGKNAILIIEFAVQRHHEGSSIFEMRPSKAASPLPADSDDLVRFHRGSDSAGPSHRPGRHRKPHDRHHRRRRDALGHGLRSA